MKKLGIGTIIISVIILAVGIIMKVRRYASVGIIGGADGPTAVFVAGKIPGGIGIIGMALGLILLGLGVYFIFRKK